MDGLIHMKGNNPMFYSMENNYYAKIRQCDYCKDLDCEIVMVNTRLGLLCPNCEINIYGRDEKTTEAKEKMAIEIETY
jgi:hypothetical protein